ncbi:DUF5710 domain-containing protein [Rhizobium jaguaris]|uniref:DUF5710 domain-containing protein n=1 Tax=Rhizobium jaguaris TaxID=1312183 RepID=A0A387G8N4_9HYPH|nr:DUF5710 domain-containing protein [Rhizobium jaguaris]AYG64192.1 hypothetical protein CCGE525_36240 [Rhizobium jaguaris]
MVPNPTQESNWQDRAGENVFEMCIANCGPGFWIRRTTWGNSLARIVGVGPITQPAPYFGNPSVLMDVYSLSGELKDTLAPVPVAGTYKTWRRIDPPAWTDAGSLRPLDDPAIDEALAKLDKRRGKQPGGRFSYEPPVGVERTMLKVPFARKEEAKAIGARWSLADKSWWLQAGNDAALAKARKLGFLD